LLGTRRPWPSNGQWKQERLFANFFLTYWQREVSPFSLSKGKEQRYDSLYQPLISSSRWPSDSEGRNLRPLLYIYARIWEAPYIWL
jgi:hypothetical protein